MMAKIPKFKARPINKKLVLDSHRWVPLPGVGFSANSFGDENHEDVTPPSNLVEHPPLAVFVNGMQLFVILVLFGRSSKLYLILWSLQKHFLCIQCGNCKKGVNNRLKAWSTKLLEVAI